MLSAYGLASSRPSDDSPAADSPVPLRARPCRHPRPFTGTWTPTVTFATPGDLSVAYSTRLGNYTKIGNKVTVDFAIVTSTFTHTTAAGNLQVSGLPFTSQSSNFSYGGVQWQGITKANYTDVVSNLGSSTSVLVFIASGSAQTNSNVAAANMPTGGTVILAGTISYIANA